MTERTGIIETTERRSQLMARVRQMGTPAEIAVRKLISGLGHGFRVQGRDLPGSPDIVNRSKRWVVFVNGCYWHAHKKCSRYAIPTRNREFWRNKFSANRKRDSRNERELAQLGYRVLVIWECELSHLPFVLRKLKVFFDEVDRNTFVVNGQRYPQLMHSYSSSGSEIRLSIKITSEHVLRRRRSVGKIRIGTDPAEDMDRSFLRKKSMPSLQHSDVRIQCADLFSGCGGLTLGVRTACQQLGIDFESALAIDSHADAIRVFAENFCVKKTYTEDIRELFPRQFGEAAANSEINVVGCLPQIDILVAGPPCQGHSDLNNHTRRTDLRNELYLRVARFVELVRPTFVLVENVPTVVHARQRLVSKTTAYLKRLGYFVDSGSVDLLALGVPQTRRRHILVGSLHGEVDIKDVVNRFKVAKPRTVSWAIDDLASTNSNTHFDSASNLSALNRKRIEFLFANDLYDLPTHLRPKCHQKDHSYKSMYGRLKLDQPAQTITTGFRSPGQGRFIHPIEPRTLTAHEAARLQCFPDFFDFSSVESRTALATMIGNAVPMQLSYAFAIELLSRLYRVKQ